MPPLEDSFPTATTQRRTGVERGRAGAALGGVLGTLVGACAVSLPGLQLVLLAVPGGLLGGVAAGGVLGIMTGALLGITFSDAPELRR
jgi:hypothetical protein